MIADTLAGESSTALQARYRIGGWIDEALRNDGSYGSHAVEKLAAYFRCDASLLYDYRNFAQTFTPAAIEVFTTRRLGNGSLITYSHLMMLVRLKSTIDRQKWLERIYAESLSCRDLERLTSDLPRKNIRTGKRKMGYPSSPIAGVYQIAVVTEKLTPQFAVWEEAVFGAIDRAPSKELDGVMERRLVSAAEGLASLAIQVGQARQRLATNLERVRLVLKLRAETSAATSPTPEHAAPASPPQEAPDDDVANPDDDAQSPAEATE